MMPDSNKELLPEWQAARDVVAKIDENLYDLRKYGFSFVAGLLTVDALFARTSNILPGSKPALIVGTMALIVVLALVDRNYRVIQQGASLRATLLERRSSPELTQMMTRIYVLNRNRLAFALAYMSLAGVTWIVGALLLQGIDYVRITAAAVIAIGLIALIEISLDQRPWVYFEIDGFVYKKGAPILAVVTNLSDSAIKLNGEVLTVYKEEEPGMPPVRDYSMRADLKNEVVVAKQSDYRWQIPTKDLEPGLYRIVYKGPIYVSARLAGMSIGRYKPIEGMGNKDWNKGQMWANAPRFIVTD